MTDRQAIPGDLVRKLNGVAPSASRTAPREEPVDLHADLGELLRWLRQAAERGDVIDAYLTACGISQIIEDWSDATAWRARQATALLGDRRRSARMLRTGVDLAAASRRTTAAGMRASALHDAAGALVRVLADAITVPLLSDVDEQHGPARFPDTGRFLVRLLAGCRLDRLPTRLFGQVQRPPSCFRSFDQHPRDMLELARRFAAQHPDRDKPLIVLGVRTSGGYLAPLVAAALRALGYLQAGSVSARPGAALPRTALLNARAGRAGGVVLVVDDPPTTGGSLAAVARSVCRRGFHPQQVVPLFASFGSAAPPTALRGHPCVILPPEDWHIRTLLDRSALGPAVAAAFPRHGVLDADIDVELPGLPTRDGHLSVRLTARLRDGGGDEAESVELVAEGAGTGYFARHATAVSASLPGLVPTVHGLRDGVLLRSTGVPCPPQAVPAETVVGYVAARQRLLPVPRDRGDALRGRQPVWEIGARILGREFGRLSPLLRPLLIDPLMQSFLRAERPCLVDGRTAAADWLLSEQAPSGAFKADFDDGCFSHHDLACYDTVYDLAGAAARNPAAEQELLSGWQRVTGERPDPVRWSVYLLVHAWNLERLGRRVEPADQARVVQSLFGGLFLGDLDDEPDGPWCVLDVDGVLELDFGGFPVTTLSAMTALRALRAHGYRVLLATGRSAADVRDRCAAYRLAGGVAEYGAVIYDAGSGRTVAAPATADGAAARRALTADLATLPSVRLDPEYACCVRASQHAGGKRRATGLDADTLRRIAAEYPDFAAVAGDAQTDFVPRGIEKSAGVQRLLGLIGDSAPVELAVGDTAMDLGILRMARIGLAPGHADRALHDEGVVRTRAAYQDGLAQAVGQLLGHRPGSCPTCRAPQLTPGEQLVLTLLSAAQGGRRGLPAAAVRLAALRRSDAARAGGAAWSR